MAVRLGDPVEKSYGRDDINDRYHRVNHFVYISHLSQNNCLQFGSF